MLTSSSSSSSSSSSLFPCESSSLPPLFYSSSSTPSLLLMGTSNWALTRPQKSHSHSHSHSHSQGEEDDDIHLAFWGPLPTPTTTPNTNTSTTNPHSNTNPTTIATPTTIANAIANANANSNAHAHADSSHLLLPLKTEDCLTSDTNNHGSCISSSSSSLLLHDLTNGGLSAALRDMRNPSSMLKRPRQLAELDHHLPPSMPMLLSSSDNANTSNNTNSNIINNNNNIHNINNNSNNYSNMELLTAEYDHNPSSNLPLRRPVNGDSELPSQQLAQIPDIHEVVGMQPPAKKKRNLPGTPDPDAEVIALSPGTLLATNRFLCEICGKGFQRDQNLQLHRRGHNLPWKLRQRNMNEVARKKVYVCPESSCVHHEAARALGDLTGIKKHFLRKHGDKKWKCDKCNKRYAVQSDWKAHLRTCGTKEYLCDCGTKFARKDSFVTHRAFCEAIAQESAMASQHVTIPSCTETATGIPSSSSSSPSNHHHHHHHHHHHNSSNHHQQQQMLMVMPPPHAGLAFDRTQNSVSSVMGVDQLLVSSSSQNQQQEHPMFSLWHKSNTPPGFFPTNSNDPMLLGLSPTGGGMDITTPDPIYTPSSDKSGYINLGNSHGLFQKASTQMGSNLNGSHFWPDWGLQGRANSNFIVNDDLSQKMGNYSSSITRMWTNESSSSSSSSAIATMQGGFGGSSILHFPVDLGVQDLVKSLSESSNSTRSTFRPNNLQSSFDVYEFLQNPCEVASSSIQEVTNPNSMLEMGGQFRSSINNPSGHLSTMPPPPPYRPTLDFLGLGGVSHHHPPPIGHPVRPILAHMHSDMAFDHHHMHANSNNISSAEPSP